MTSMPAPSRSDCLKSRVMTVCSVTSVPSLNRDIQLLCAAFASSKSSFLLMLTSSWSSFRGKLRGYNLEYVDYCLAARLQTCVWLVWADLAPLIACILAAIAEIPRLSARPPCFMIHPQIISLKDCHENTASVGACLSWSLMPTWRQLLGIKTETKRNPNNRRWVHSSADLNILTSYTV